MSKFALRISNNQGLALRDFLKVSDVNLDY